MFPPTDAAVAGLSSLDINSPSAVISHGKCTYCPHLLETCIEIFSPHTFIGASVLLMKYWNWKFH